MKGLAFQFLGWEYAGRFRIGPSHREKTIAFLKRQRQSKKMSHLRAGRKRNLLPKIGGARKKWFHQDPVPSTDGGVSFLCPLSSSRSGTCASLLVRKQATAFLTTEYSELVPAKPGLLPSFY